MTSNWSRKSSPEIRDTAKSSVSIVFNDFSGPATMHGCPATRVRSISIAPSDTRMEQLFHAIKWIVGFATKVDFFELANGLQRIINHLAVGFRIDDVTDPLKLDAIEILLREVGEILRRGRALMEIQIGQMTEYVCHPFSGGIFPVSWPPP